MKEIKNKDTIKNILKFILAFALFYYSSYLQYIPIILFRIKTPISEKTAVILSLFSNTLLAIILFLIYKKELINEWKKYKKNFLDCVDVGIKSWFIGMVVMFVLNFILMRFNAGESKNEELVQQMITALPWIMLINAGLIGPFIEEIVFRKSIRDIFYNKYSYIIISGLVFGLMHVVSTFDSFLSFLYFLPYTALGIAFAYSYYKTETIFTSTTVHIIHNTSLILLSILPTLFR